MRVTLDFTKSMEGVLTVEDEFQVVPGKRHRTRDGNVVGPVRRNLGSSRYPFKLGKGGPDWTWQANGRWFSDNTETKRDLVAVVEDEQE